MTPTTPTDGSPTLPGTDQEDAGSAAIHDLLPLLYRQRPDLANRVRCAIARPDLTGRVQHAIARSERRRMLLTWAAAAGIALLLGGMVLFVSTHQGDGRGGDGGLCNGEGRPVPAGAELVASDGQWSWPATGARFAMTADSSARRGTGPGELQLDMGVISATVDTHQQRTPLVIHTPHAIATVMGTSFRIETDATHTLLQVDRGTVSFQHDGRDERVQAGTTATAPELMATTGPATLAEATSMTHATLPEPASTAARPTGTTPAQGTAMPASGPAWELQEDSRNSVTDRRLREFSGMTTDPLAPDRLWACGDHGNPATLFSIDHQGRVLEEMPVAGAVNHDWEELCQVRIGDHTWLAIGDIGKSRRQLPAAILLVEPHPPLRVARRIELSLPPGVVDMDCLTWDAIEQAFYLVGKDGDHPLLRCAWGEGSPLTAVTVARVKAHRPAALAIDHAGQRMALLDENGSLTVFGRRDGAWDVARPRIRARVTGMPMPQALAWDPDGSGLWMAGEGSGSPLVHMRGTFPAP